MRPWPLYIAFNLLQRDTTGLSAENAELKIRLQAMEQQAQLRDGEHCPLIEDNIIYLSIWLFDSFYFPVTWSIEAIIRQCNIFLTIYNRRSFYFSQSPLIPFPFQGILHGQLQKSFKVKCLLTWYPSPNCYLISLVFLYVGSILLQLTYCAMS